MIFDVLKWFRGGKVKDEKIKKEAAFVSDFENIDEFNIGSIVANKLANIVCAEADISVLGDGERAGYLDKCLRRVVKRLKPVTVRAFGIGGVVLKPYIFNGEIYTDILPQDRFFVLEQFGEVVTKAGFLAEEFDVSGEDNTEQEGLLKGSYARIEYHSLNNEGLYTIETVALRDGREIPLESVPAWSGIEPVVGIPGVSQMLFAIVTCPVDSRGDLSDVYGVPVTYGQDKLVGMVLGLLNEIPDEYKNKKAFIGAEDLLFDGDDNLPSSGLYKLFRANGGVDNKSFWEVFSPDIRHTSYFEGLNYLFGLLEKAIAVNRGVLTDLESGDATATAIKRSMFDTFCLADAMRKNIEYAFYDLLYAYDVVATAFGLCAKGENDGIRFDWSYSLLEDSAESFSQLVEGQAIGAVEVSEVREWLGL